MTRGYDRFLEMLAALGAACIAFVLVAVLYDVTRRTLGFGSAIWVTPVTEYALLYTVAFAGPWLVREKGHILIESLVEMLRPSLRHAVEVFGCTLCISLCAALLYYFTVSGWESFRWSEVDLRGIAIPRWLMYLPMTVMFALSAIEFARFVFGPRSLLSGHGNKTDGM